MWRYLVFLRVVALGALAFAPAPIRWGGLPARRFVLTPEALLNTARSKAVVLPQKLTIQDQLLLGNGSPEEIPLFVPQLDRTIMCGAAGLCLSAFGSDDGDAIGIDHCSGEPNQLWNFSPWRDSGERQIQLLHTSKCIDVNSQGDVLNGAPVELRECNHAASELWKFDEPISLPSHASAQRLAPSSYVQHVTVSCISMAAFGALMLSAWFWWQRASLGAASAIHGGMTLKIERGGVVPFAGCRAGAPLIPALMVLRPEKEAPAMPQKATHHARDVQITQSEIVLPVLSPNHGGDESSSRSFESDSLDQTRRGGRCQMSDSLDRSVESSTDSFWSKLKQSILGDVQPSWELAAIATVYFAQGAIGLAALAKTFYFKDTLHLGPTETAAIAGVISTPWVLKPLYGFLSDGVPLFGYRRRSYLLGAGALGGASWLALASGLDRSFGDMAIPATVALCTAGSLAIAVSDVVVDGVVVERTSAAERNGEKGVAGSLQSLCWGSRSVGAIATSYLGGELLEISSPQAVFGITAIFPLLVAATSYLINEERVNGESEQSQGIMEQVRALWEAVRQPQILLPALFMFAWQATPNSNTAFLYFLTNEIGMGPEFLGRASLAASLASFAGVALYSTYLKKVPVSTVLKYSAIASAVLGLTPLLLVTHVNRQLGIPDGFFVIGDDVILALLGQVAFMPTLTLAARLCPAGVEGSLFALLMSVYNGGSILSSELGAALTSALGVTESNFENLPLLITICSVSSLLPLPFIGVIEKGENSENS